MWKALIMDAGNALRRAIGAIAPSASVVEEISSRSWASITFTGARHRIVLRLDGAGANEAADRLFENLKVAEFELRGHVVADIGVVAREIAPNDGVRLTIEALTVEDA